MKPTSNKSASRESSEFEFVSSGPGISSGAMSPSTVSVKSDKNNVEDETVSGLFGWVKGTGSGILSKVAEKTKSSVESVITTLDPQMRDYIHSGGDFRVIVASDKEVKVSLVREAFQSVFGKATVFGLASQPTSVAAQPVGFAAGRQAANERIQSLRPKAEPQDILVAVESFLLEIGADEWVELSCLLLLDVARNISLATYTQMTPISTKFINVLKKETGENYPKRWSGFAVTIGSVIEKEMNVPKERWHEAVCGMSRREIGFLSAKSLANMYKKTLIAKVQNI